MELEMEMLIWEYIDGTCNEADRKRVALLIDENPAWKEKYRVLHALHTTIPDGLELEQPSMRFTKNVMEAIAHTSVAPATSKYINYNIIRGIAAFFIGTIALFLGYAVLTANRHSGNGILINLRTLKEYLPENILNSGIVNIIIAVNVVLALALADAVIRKRRYS